MQDRLTQPYASEKRNLVGLWKTLMRCDLHTSCTIIFSVIMCSGNSLQVIRLGAIDPSAVDTTELQHHLAVNHVCPAAGDTARSH